MTSVFRKALPARGMTEPRAALASSGYRQYARFVVLIQPRRPGRFGEPHSGASPPAVTHYAARSVRSLA